LNGGRRDVAQWHGEDGHSTCPLSDASTATEDRNTAVSAVQPLMKLLTGRRMNVTKRVEALARLFDEESRREKPRISLTQRTTDGRDMDVLMLFIELERQCSPASTSDNRLGTLTVQQQTVREYIWPVVLSIMQQGEYDATHMNAAGDSALNLLTSTLLPDMEGDVIYELASELIRLGSDVNHASGSRHSPPLLIWARESFHCDVHLSVIHLLLINGSDMNLPDGDGDGLLHHIVYWQWSDLLERLTHWVDVSGWDFALVNKTDTTLTGANKSNGHRASQWECGDTWQQGVKEED